MTGAVADACGRISGRVGIVSTHQGCGVVIGARIASDGGAWWLTEAFTGH